MDAEAVRFSPNLRATMHGRFRGGEINARESVGRSIQPRCETGR
jgi:hypothetical protein